jgi:hypothetical protein
MQVDQEEPHVEEQQQQTQAENKAESEEMEVQVVMNFSLLTYNRLLVSAGIWFPEDCS